MKRPTDEEIRIATKAAEQLRETGNDPVHIAHTLLYWKRRMQEMETAVKAADLYIHSGMGEVEHAQLVLALEKLRRDEDDEEGGQEEFGLA